MPLLYTPFKKQYWIFGLVVLLLSCNNHSKQTDKPAEADTTVANLKRLRTLSDETETMGGVMERLQTLTPLSLEQVKNLLPSMLNGYTRTSLKSDATEGFASAQATYETQPGVGMQLSIQDCAGEAGAGNYTLHYWNALNVTEENEDGYIGTVPLNGGKAIEEYKKQGEETSLTWFAAGRLLVVLRSKGLNAAILHQAAQLLDFKL